MLSPRTPARRESLWAIAAAIPGARSEFVDGTKHMLVQERPREVADRLLAFLT